ncbi:MAG: hypothetical protein E6J90_21655 [Deltaproteobacteria bacterium]|nr:MAG: hypothetical protein E6J91_11710 [Deltaproteobacteria bacterium]TMQ17854.1 MAG: hypothetical protein E6J90_21655 [Deltaproteobacteria bacterium]
MRAIGFLLVTLAVGFGSFGCGSTGRGDDVSDPGDDGHALVVPLDGSQTQGKYLLGETLDGLGQEPGYHANAVTRATTADGQAVTIAFDGSAALRSGSHRGTDPFFDGMLLTGSQGAHLRIKPLRGGTDLATYRLELRTPAGWVDQCGGGEAVPLAGKWQKSGFHEYAADRISFACTGSVAYKCTLWGYLAGSDATAMGWRAHQACTRMARGDYCAAGHSRTREGTPIQIFDVIGVGPAPPRHFEGVQNWPPDPDRMFFEAAWNDAAHPASCLSRRRWQGLPIGPLCDHDDLPDPRQDTGVRFCEDIEWPAPGSEPTGALLFNVSRYTDLALHVWKCGDTDLVSTVRGFYQLPDVIQPFPNMGTCEHVRNDGIVLRALRSDLNPDDFWELSLFRKAGDAVVARTAEPPPGFVPGIVPFEGYAFKAQSGDLVPLNLYLNTATGDRVSTTATPGDPYVLESVIGYVFRPETR